MATMQQILGYHKPPFQGTHALGRCQNAGIRRPKLSASAATATPEASTVLIPQGDAGKVWRDEFSALEDRFPGAKPPKPLKLPAIRAAHCVTIVRHGQSTWNAEERVQGSSNNSVLTEKGVAQAQSTASMLAGETYHQMWFSPLARAAETAKIVWGNRVGPQHCDPVLREIDLYSFQGLEKRQVKSQFASEYDNWHNAADKFQLDGHYPVHETWYRASLAWQKILASEPSASKTLIVAHNNTNQALIATALQLPCTFFRRLTQNNAAVSQLQFTPSEDDPSQPPEVVLLCLNKSPSNPVKPSSKVTAKICLLVVHPGEAEQQACAQLLSAAAVHSVVVLPSHDVELKAMQDSMAQLVKDSCRTASGAEPDSVTIEQEAGNESWQAIVRKAAQDGGCNVVVVCDPQAAAGLTCSAFGLGQMARHMFTFSHGGVSVFDFKQRPSKDIQAAAHCLNNTAHLDDQSAVASLQ